MVAAEDVHPRDGHGREIMAPDDVAVRLEAIQTAWPSTSVGLSTGACIVPEVDRKRLTHLHLFVSGAFLVECRDDGKARNPGAEATKLRRGQAAGGGI